MITTFYRKLSLYIPLFLSLLFLAACDGQGAVRYHIGVSQCSNDAWRTKLNEEMKRELLFHPEMEMEVRSADDDNDRQVSDIEYFIEKKVDLLIVSPREAAKLTPVMSQAFDAGIPVIVADRKMTNEKYTAFIGGDNLVVGHQMGLYLHQQLPQGGKVLEILGLDGSTPATLRHQGLMEEIEESGIHYEIIQCRGNWLKEQSETVVDSILNLHPDIQIILAQNDQMAMGADIALEKHFPGNLIPIMGVDALTGTGNGVEAITQGRIDASAVYATGGDIIIQTAAKILQGKPFERNIALDTYLVNAESAPLLNNVATEVAHQVEAVQMLKSEVDRYWEQHNLERTLLYSLLVFLFIFILMYMALMRQLKAKHLAQSQLEEATKAKLSFFTNVSHDFRTPLTLIAAPLEKLLTEVKEPHQLQLLNIANKNTQVLLRLINQILDFRKMESGKMELNLQNLDLKQEVETWFASFNGLAHKKHIKLELDVKSEELGMEDENPFLTQGDAAKLERVFYNIVGNAFKFTPENGKISISLTKQHTNTPVFVLTIADTGPGINNEHIQKIFDSFYQIDSLHHDGSGLGLALVKNFVELHEGTIEVGNQPEGTGTVITVTLPARNPDTSAETITPIAKISTQQVETELDTFGQEYEVAEDDPKPVLLVIDDNPDIRQMLSSLLADSYHVFTASNGQEGISKAMRLVPNLIICDVMMPGMDGMECCHRLKNEVNTCHIPVLMLTACSLDEQRIQGLHEGADAYVAKPFNVDVLRAQIETLIKNHDRVRDFFGEGNKTPSPLNKRSDITSSPSSSLDDKFMERVRKCIDAHLSDADFGVEQLGEEIGMSRAQLYRKCKTLTNYSPVELIRNTRLKRAQQLLAQSDDTIAEVAYAVGFTAPSYFTKCYKEFFGENPNELVKRKG
ncbi:MAG: substrate-binding domain-containing protein [Bacteroidales bacterium]|nr:substrate-binding domain-containing protein [Bacteroidales bacterium]